MVVQTASGDKIPAWCRNIPRSDFDANQHQFKKNVCTDNLIEKFVGHERR